MNFSAPDSLSLGVRPVLLWITEEFEPLLGMRCRVLVEGCMVHTRRWPWNLAVICRRIEIDDMKTVLEEIYTRDEGFSLNAILI
jgi:hypothetical protein